MHDSFDKMIDRTRNNSYKWDVAPGELPMFVADMDFATAPAVVTALTKRVHENAFGYNTVPDSFKESIIAWWQRRHQVMFQKEWILYCTGVVPAISSIVRKMTDVHDNVVVLSPVYNIFYNSILNNDRQVLASEMMYREGDYTINFADLEAKLARPETTLFIFCNPHNPIGKIWKKAMLEKIGMLCVKHQVLLLSDEIHCDLTHVGKTYQSLLGINAAIDQNTIACVAPTKTFNLAGLQTSAIVIPNAALRKKVDRGINTDEVAEPNTFAIQAAEAAFNKGEPWLNALQQYLEQNKTYLHKFIKKELPEITIVPAEATYLAWLDCSQITDDTEKLVTFIRKETGLYLSAGAIFGGNGNRFIRWNYACPKERLLDGTTRFKKAIDTYRNN
jgi:cystathionine beta-lyase